MEKKQLNKVYNPHQVESRLYEHWEKEGFFLPSEVDGPTYFIPMPPPNITGSLHLGHALNNTMQDILARWKRMAGYSTLWVPGTDHASIATEVRVVAALEGEGLTKEGIGREAFLERLWQWNDKYGGEIIHQLKRLGCSCDWSRNRFTMDESLNRAVREVFVRYYEEGLIYRGDYIVNWCPICKTTLSDIEVEHKETGGNLYYIEYPLIGEEGHLTIATTRPETMLGDTGVAVHPDDNRYKEYIGKKVLLPLVGKEIPIIADKYVDPEFGTGALKITPGHDPNDYEIGLRHNLPAVHVINESGKMTEAAGRYSGLAREECRKKIVLDLKENNHLVKTEDYTHAVSHCYRCHNPIEPLVSKQWFVKMEELAAPAVAAVEEGRVKFFPPNFARVYLQWMEEIRDWCISRQLWWGHRIPVWYCQDCDEMIVSVEEPQSCPRCGKSNLKQDPDILDTWFSSALWPFSILGWPEETADLKKFYPADILVTGRDIIFFWVARMIFSSLKFMDREPFPHTLITGMVRDAEGRIMSKSKGIGVDPLEIIEKYGADTLRFSLIAGMSMGTDLRFREERVEAARNFTNKLWNAARFLLMNLEENIPNVDMVKATSLDGRWILSRLQTVIGNVTRYLSEYRFSDAAQAIYDFAWNDFCDWYIEMAKPALYGVSNEGQKEEALIVLIHVLDNLLRLLHPIMPFITEEIWQGMPHAGPTIMKSDWPRVEEDLIDLQAEEEMGTLQDIVRSIRKVRQELEVHPQRKIQAIISPPQQWADLLEKGAGYIKIMAGVGELNLRDSMTDVPKDSVATVVRGIEISLPLAGMVDIKEEIIRLEKSEQKLAKELIRVNRQLANDGFLAKAPAKLVAEEKRKQKEYNDSYNSIKERICRLKEALAGEEGLS